MSDSETATCFRPQTEAHSYAVTPDSTTVRLRAVIKKAASRETAFHNSCK